MKVKNGNLAGFSRIYSLFSQSSRKYPKTPFLICNCESLTPKCPFVIEITSMVLTCSCHRQGCTKCGNCSGCSCSCLKTTPAKRSRRSITSPSSYAIAGEEEFLERNDTPSKVLTIKDLKEIFKMGKNTGRGMPSDLDRKTKSLGVLEERSRDQMVHFAQEICMEVCRIVYP